VTDYYLKSGVGLDTNSGLSWALAKATLNGIAAVATAPGDRVFISHLHAENINTNQNYGSAGNDNNPIKYLCVNDTTGEPPTQAPTGGAVVQGGPAVNSVVIGGGHWYGITFELAPGGVNNINVIFNAAVNSRYESCNFKLNATGNSSKFSFGNGNGRKHFVNCGFRLATAAQALQLTSTDFHWQGGSIIAGGATPTVLFFSPTAGSGNRCLIENVDFSALGVGFTFFAVVQQAQWSTIVRNCRLPAGWTGSLMQGGTPNFTIVGIRVCMYNCWNSTERYKVWIEDFAGTIRDDATITRVGGNPYTLKLTSNAKNLNGQPTTALRTDELVRKITTIGNPVTISAHVCSDTATPIDNSQAWIEVSYLSAAGHPLGTLVSDSAALLMTPAAQDAGDAWNTGAMANPDRRKLSVTFIPQRVGYVHAKVHWNKPSSVLYVDEMLELS